MAGVEDAGGRRWRRSSCLLRRRKEEDEDKGQGKSEKKDPLSLFIRKWIDGMRGNRGG